MAPETFGGAVLCLMGLNLVLDAPERAKAVAQLQGESRDPLPRITAGYRIAGLLLSAGGSYLLSGPKSSGSPPGGRAAGLALTALGFMLAIQKAYGAGGSRLGKFLPEEEVPLARKAASLTSWLLALSLLAYGLALLGRS